MKLEPLTYRKPTGNPVGVYYASMSPDGWTQNFYQPELSDNLTPDELLSFIQVVSEFIHRIKSLDDLSTYSANNGKKLSGGVVPTYGILYEHNQITCDAHITGCNCMFYPFRKEE